MIAPLQRNIQTRDNGQKLIRAVDLRLESMELAQSRRCRHESSFTHILAENMLPFPAPEPRPTLDRRSDDAGEHVSGSWYWWYCVCPQLWERRSSGSFLVVLGSATIFDSVATVGPSKTGGIKMETRLRNRFNGQSTMLNS